MLSPIGGCSSLWLLTISGSNWKTLSESKPPRFIHYGICSVPITMTSCRAPQLVVVGVGLHLGPSELLSSGAIGTSVKYNNILATNKHTRPHAETKNPLSLLLRSVQTMACFPPLLTEQ